MTDEELLTRLRRDHGDPLSMCIVVRKKTSFDMEHLLLQVCEATRAANASFIDDKKWCDSYSQWLRGSFRKIALKARDTQFDELIKLGAVNVGDVAICPPQRRSDRWQVLDKLQAITNLGVRPLCELQASPLPGLIFVRDALHMSDGKIIAQVAHASLMAADAELRSVKLLKDSAWDLIAESHIVICVRDAGITEVPKGSETVMVVIV